MVTDTSTKVGMICEMVDLTGHGGTTINAYVARPTGAGPFPSMVLIHHAPGWDEWYFEATRRFAQHGYASICPNLYARAGHGTPEEVGAIVRTAGGVADDQVVGDLEAAVKWARAQPGSNGKVGIFGTCSGGRHAFLVAARLGTQIDAMVECWSGGIVQAELTPARPVSPHTLSAQVTAPILGLFGNDDRNPTPEQVDEHEAELKRQGNNYEFYRYDGAPHGFFYYDRAAYRQEQAVDGWKKIWEFLPKHLG
ncbi:MAG: dienelactone hydrolase family protein [Dehalococcoidia bacterium]|nr:dienelactone hydrolase family protein [Dehalococcoidia bacterium]